MGRDAFSRIFAEGYRKCFPCEPVSHFFAENAEELEGKLIGHRHIIEYRREGQKPVAIFIEAGFEPVPFRFEFEKAELAIDHGFFPTVTVLPDELGKHLDLRFCAGCRVHVHGNEWTEELIGFAERVVAAGAAHVIVAVLADGEILEWKGEWIGHASART